MSLARLPCRLFLKAHAYVSQPLGHVLTNTHTHIQPFTCAQTIEHKYLHTHCTYTLIYACIHTQAVLGPLNNHIKPYNMNTHTSLYALTVHKYTNIITISVQLTKTHTSL